MHPPQNVNFYDCCEVSKNKNNDMLSNSVIEEEVCEYREKMYVSNKTPAFASLARWKTVKRTGVTRVKPVS